MVILGMVNTLTQIFINVKSVIFLNMKEEEQSINTNDKIQILKQFNEK